jgi:hypothetical protein
MSVSTTPAQRFARYADASAGPDCCWPWTGTRVEDGYGQVQLQNVKRPATHLALALDGRPRPDGAQALHSCDNPPCVNPRHLRWGTNAENLAERNAKGRQARGDRHGRSRLTNETARLARQLVATGATQTSVAARLGVRRGVITDLIRGRTWTHGEDMK